jgi:regulator of cell morphogenesis and NO signaling
MIDETTILALSVNETIRRYPATVAVFNQHGIDACCGGALPIDEAVAHGGAERGAFMEDLMRAIREAA